MSSQTDLVGPDNFEMEANGTSDDQLKRINRKTNEKLTSQMFKVFLNLSMFENLNHTFCDFVRACGLTPI